MTEPTFTNYLCAIGWFPPIGLAWCGYLGFWIVRELTKGRH
jgi:hypothetical protein